MQGEILFSMALLQIPRCVSGFAPKSQGEEETQACERFPQLSIPLNKLPWRVTDVQASKSCFLQRRVCRPRDPSPGALHGPPDGFQSPGHGCSVPARVCHDPWQARARRATGSTRGSFGNQQLLMWLLQGNFYIIQSSRASDAHLVAAESPTSWAERPPAPSNQYGSAHLPCAHGGWVTDCSHDSLVPALLSWGKKEKRCEASNFQSCQNDASYQHEKISKKS